MWKNSKDAFNKTRAVENSCSEKKGMVHGEWAKNQRLLEPAHGWIAQSQVYFCLCGKTSLCAKLLVWKYMSPVRSFAWKSSDFDVKRFAKALVLQRGIVRVKCLAQARAQTQPGLKPRLLEIEKKYKNQITVCLHWPLTTFKIVHFHLFVITIIMLDYWNRNIVFKLTWTWCSVKE